MKKMFAALTVLTLVFAVALAAPANASKVYLFAPNQNEGGNN
jgi:acid phosphatase class B